MIPCEDLNDHATIPVVGDLLKKDIVTNIENNVIKNMTAGAGRLQSAGMDTGGGNIGSGF